MKINSLGGKMTEFIKGPTLILLYISLLIDSISGRVTEINGFSNDVLRFIDFINTCTKHIFLDFSDQRRFQDYTHKLHQSESTNPSVLTLVSLHNYVKYDDGRTELYSLPDISNVLKHSKCIVYIYFISQPITFISHVSPLYNLNLFERYNIHELSTFKVVVTSEFTTIEQFPSHFPASDGTIVQIHNKSQLNMICSHCNNFSTPIHDFKPSLTNFNTYWNLLHRNQHGYLLGIRHIFLPFQYTDKPSYYECGRWPFIRNKKHRSAGYIFPPEICTFFGFASRYNFTLVDAYQNTFFRAVRMNLRPFFSVSGIATFKNFYNTKGVIYFNVQTEPYHFMVVLDSTEIAKTNRNAFLTSMDQLTWLMCMISITAISLSLYYFNIIVYEQNVFYVLIEIFGTLINQGMRLPNITFPLLLTFGIWSLVTIVITNGYAGLLLSLLTKLKIPYVPQDITGLLNSPHNFNFATFESYVGKTDNAFIVEQKVDSLFLESVRNYNHYSFERGRNCSVCDQLVKKITYLKPFPNSFSIENIIGSLLVIKNPDQYAYLPFPYHNKSISVNFVFIDQRSMIKYTEETLRLVFKKQKVVATVGQALPFSKTNVCSAPHSYASKMAVSYFSRMYSSGIFNLWALSYELYYTRYVSYAHERMLNLTRKRSRYSDLLLGNVYENPDPQKLTLEHFLIPFYVLFTACISSTVCFVFEFFCHLINIYVGLIIILAGIQTIKSN